MRTYKRETFEQGQYTLLSGAAKHEVELVPGDLDLWVDFYSDREVVCWLYFQSGLRVPYRRGYSCSFNLRLRDVLSVVLETEKTATVVIAAQYKELAVGDKLDYTPIVIDPPRAAQLDLSAVMRREVAEYLNKMGYVKPGETLTVDDEDNLEEEEDEEGFGPGYMEEEVPPTAPVRGRGRKSPTASGEGGSASSDPGIGDSAAVGDKPAPDSPKPKS